MGAERIQGREEDQARHGLLFRPRASELYLNGAKVGDAVLSPAVAQYDKRAFYVAHDVTEQLKRGANAMGVVLGGGRYSSDRSKVYAGTMNFGWPKLLLHLRIEHTDGSVSEVVSDENGSSPPTDRFFPAASMTVRDYDARKELRGWNKIRYNDAFWQTAKLVAAPGELSAQMIEPIRVTQTIRPISYREIKPGVLVYDMGQNMVGWCRLKVKGSAGINVQMRFAETVNPDGSLYMANLRGARVTDNYTLQGGARKSVSRASRIMDFVMLK